MEANKTGFVLKTLVFLGGLFVLLAASSDAQPDLPAVDCTREKVGAIIHSTLIFLRINEFA